MSDVFTPPVVAPATAPPPPNPLTSGNPASQWACIFRGGGLGDNIIASSVLPGLRKRYGHMEVISARPAHVIFENNPFVDKLAVRDPGDPNWGDGNTWQAWFAHRAKEYGFFANLSHSCETLGVFLKIQTPFWWPVEMRRKMAPKSYLELVHDICNIPYDEIAPNFYPTDRELQQGMLTKAKVSTQTPVVGWVLSGTRCDKIHPQADVMIARILKAGLPVIMFGAPGKDLEMAKLVQSEVVKNLGSDKGLHLALSPDPNNPSWPIRRICTQVQLCDVVVGPDTGPMWAVAMHSMPKIVMHSHASVANITKYWKNTISLHADPERVPCWPCHRLHDDHTTCVVNADGNGAACISDIRIDDMTQAVRAAIEKTPLDPGNLMCSVVADSYNALHVQPKE